MADPWLAGHPAAAESPPAVGVAALLRRSFEHLAGEVPQSFRHLVGELGPLVVEVDVGGELFSVRGGGGLAVADGPSGTADVRIRTSREAVLEVLDAALGLPEAVETDRVQVHGALDDVVRAHDALIAYAHAAVRAPSLPGLLTALRDDPGGPR